MKIVKQMVMHLGILYEKSYACRAYLLQLLYILIPICVSTSKTLTVPQKSVSDKTSTAWFI